MNYVKDNTHKLLVGLAVFWIFTTYFEGFVNNDESETENLAQLHPDIIKQARKIFKNSRSETIGFPFGGVIQNYKSMDRFEQ